MTLAGYTLDEFIHDMTDLVATQPEQAALFVLGKYDNC